MKKRLSQISWLLMLALIMISFGASLAVAESAEPIAINMTVFADSESVTSQMWDTFLALAEEKYPNYQVSIEKAPSGSPEEYIKSRVAGGDFPDIMWVFQPALLIDGGVIQELPQELEDMLLRPGDYKVNGKLYTMPRHIGALGSWYNKQIFADAGIEKLPENWEEFIEALEKIQAIGIEPLGMAAKDGWSVTGYFDFLWSPATYGAEPDWSKLRNEGQVKFNNPVTTRSFEQFQQTMPFWQKGALSATDDEVKALFYTGQIAIYANSGTYHNGEIESGNIVPQFEVGYLLPPQDKAEDRHANSFSDNLFVVSSEVQGEKFDACIDIIKMYFSEDFYPIALNSECSLPSVKGFDDARPTLTDPKAIAMFDEISAAVAQYGTVPHAHATQGDNMWPAGAREMSEKVVQEVAAGNTDVDMLMNMFDEQWDKGIEQANQG